MLLFKEIAADTRRSAESAPAGIETGVGEEEWPGLGVAFRAVRSDAGVARDAGIGTASCP
jgi:hypothetical protein